MVYNINDLVKYKRRKERSVWAVCYRNCPTAEGERLKTVRTGTGMIARFIENNRSTRLVSGEGDGEFLVWDFDLFSIYIRKTLEGSPHKVVYTNVSRIILPGANETKARCNPRAYLVHFNDLRRISTSSDEKEQEPTYEEVGKVIYFPPLRYPKNHILRFLRITIQEKFGYRPKTITPVRKSSIPDYLYSAWSSFHPTNELELVRTQADFIDLLDKIESLKGTTPPRPVHEKLPWLRRSDSWPDADFFEKGIYENCDITQKDVDRYIKKENSRKHRVVK